MRWGHQQALSAAGIAWTQERYFCISKDRKRRSEDYRRLVECFRRMGCTACLFISDYYAVEAMDYLLDHGIRVPEDISVTGFDDNILSRIIRPRLDGGCGGRSASIGADSRLFPDTAEEEKEAGGSGGGRTRLPHVAHPCGSGRKREGSALDMVIMNKRDGLFFLVLLVMRITYGI